MMAMIFKEGKETSPKATSTMEFWKKNAHLHCLLDVFLVTSSHFYKRVCPSVRLSICPWTLRKKCQNCSKSSGNESYRRYINIFQWNTKENASSYWSYWTCSCLCCFLTRCTSAYWYMKWILWDKLNGYETIAAFEFQLESPEIVNPF